MAKSFKQFRDEWDDEWDDGKADLRAKELALRARREEKKNKVAGKLSKLDKQDDE